MSDPVSFEEFRRLVCSQVVGFPPTAGRTFDLTRRGLLDHVQRVALRALALDLRPDLAPRSDRRG